MPQITYTFTESGADKVKSAFEDIGSAAQRSSNQAKKGFRSQGDAAGRAAKTAEQAERRRLRALKKSLADVRREQAKGIREQATAARQQERADAKIARDRERREKRRVRNFGQALRKVRREQAATARAAEREQKKLASAAVARRRGRWQTAGRVIGGVARAGAVLGGAVAGFSGAASRDALSLQDRATRLSIQGGRKADGTKTASSADIVSQTQEIATSLKGIKAIDIADAVGAFVAKTGDLEKGLAFAKEFAVVALATGTDLQDIGSAAADLTEKFDIKTVDGMAEALAVLTEQGKQGAFELEDAAAVFPRIAAAASVFGLKGQKGLAQLGGLSQIARTAGGSGEQAATAVENLFRQIVAKSDKIKSGGGVDIFTDKTHTRARDIQEILPEIIKGFGGDIQKLGKIFPKASIAALNPMIKVFNDAAAQARESGQNEKQARAAGAEAVKKQLADAINVENAREKVAQDAADAQQTASASMVQAWEMVVKEVGSALVPTITEWATKLAEWVSETDFDPLVQGLEDVAEGAAALAEFLDLFPKKKKSLTEEVASRERKLENFTPKEHAMFAQLRSREKKFGAMEHPESLTSSFEQEGKDFGLLKTSADNSAESVSLFRKFEKFRKLMDEIDGLKNQAGAASSRDMLNPGEDITPASFQKRFAEQRLLHIAQNGGDITNPGTIASATKAARDIAESIIDDPNDTDFGSQLEGTPSQALIMKLAESQTARQTSTAEGVKPFTESDLTGSGAAQSELKAQVDAVGGSAMALAGKLNEAAAAIKISGGGSFQD